MIVETSCDSPDDLIFEDYTQTHDKSDAQEEGSISSWFAGYSHSVKEDIVAAVSFVWSHYLCRQEAGILDYGSLSHFLFSAVREPGP